MSFVHQEDIFSTFGGLIQHVFKKIKNYDLPDLPRLSTMMPLNTMAPTNLICVLIVK